MWQKMNKNQVGFMQFRYSRIVEKHHIHNRSCKRNYQNFHTNPFNINTAILTERSHRAVSLGPGDRTKGRHFSVDTGQFTNFIYLYLLFIYYLVVYLSQDYFIKIAPLPAFELLVNLEYSLPSLIERKNKHKRMSYGSNC